MEYGTPIQRAAHDVQEGVKKGIESMTGLHVVRVDVHVQGVSFEKENSALMAGAGKAVLESGEEEKKREKKQEEKKPLSAGELPEEPIAEVAPLEPAAEENRAEDQPEADPAE